MARLLRFGEFALNPETGELSRHGIAIPLERQPARVLVHLAAAAGETVTRDHLIARLWGPSGTHVKYDDGLNYCIRQIRMALGDDPRSPVFVATLPRRGYRFVAPVNTGERRTPAGRRSVASWSVAAALAASLVAVVESRPNNHHEIAVGLLRAVHDLVFPAR